MVILHSYVSLPEGKWFQSPCHLSITIQFSIDIYPSKNPIRSEIATPRTRGYFGKHAAVAYFDFSKDKYCLTEKHHHDEYIGCFDDED